jgi:hypothetical protein
MSPHIMVYGNPVDGFRYVGPFQSREEAYAYASNEHRDAWVTELDKPAFAMERAHRQWTFVIKETAEGFNYETSCLGGGFSPTRQGLVEAIRKLIEAYLPLPADPKPTACEEYAAWLERQPKPKTMAEALAQLPPGVTGIVLDDSPESIEQMHNVIAEAVGEAPKGEPSDIMVDIWDAGGYVRLRSDVSLREVLGDNCTNARYASYVRCLKDDGYAKVGGGAMPQRTLKPALTRCAP